MIDLKLLPTKHGLESVYPRWELGFDWRRLLRLRWSRRVLLRSLRFLDWCYRPRCCRLRQKLPQSSKFTLDVVEVAGAGGCG